jgi:cellobiose epimerase
LGCSAPRSTVPDTNAGGVSQTLARLPSRDARLEAIRTRLDALAASDWRFWKTHGPDREHGGYHGTLDRRGTPIAPTDKGLIQQARHLFATSLWYEKKERTPEVKALSEDLYRFLMQHFYDEKTRQFQLKVSRHGDPVDATKVLYANAFAVYALVEYARAYGVKAAGDTALACFRSLDAAAHDEKLGGYVLPNDPPWLTPGAAKETNTHLHLMEAFSALYAYGKDPLVRQRLEELVEIFRTKIIQNEGYARKDFLADWTPFGEPMVSYGHDLETAWLLLEAAESLGRRGDATIRKSAFTIGSTAVDSGFDPLRGGFFEEGFPAGVAVKREKIWWVQAEALPALYELYRLSHDTLYLDRLETTLDFIENFQVDREFGGWYWGIGEDGKLGPRGDAKGGEWKAAYHDLRATVLVGDWIATQKR